MTFSPTTAALLVSSGSRSARSGRSSAPAAASSSRPVLLLLYPHDRPATITAISLTAVFFNAASGSAAYAHQRRIDYRSGLAFAAAALPGSIAGALVVSSVSRSQFDLLMAIVLVALAVWLLIGEPGGRRPATRTPHPPDAHRPLRHHLRLRRPASPRNRLQHRRRLRLELPRHRRRRHPRPPARPRTRLPDPPRNRHLPLRPRDHRRKRRSNPRRRRQLRPRPRHPPRHRALDRGRRRCTTRRTPVTARERQNSGNTSRRRSPRTRARLSLAAL